MTDKPLSFNFTLFQLTQTNHAHLQEENRKVTPVEESKLSECAQLLEVCRGVLDQEIDVHSGRRCAALNKRVGSSDKSQHLRCEAVDFSPRGPDDEKTIDVAFHKLIDAAIQGKLKFGQLIFESSANGREGRSVWLHISLGLPYRDQARCGQALTMRDGHYELVAKV